jgi:hypothetical protein
VTDRGGLLFGGATEICASFWRKFSWDSSPFEVSVPPLSPRRSSSSRIDFGGPETLRSERRGSSIDDGGSEETG